MKRALLSLAAALFPASAAAHSIPQTLEVIGWIGNDPVALIHSYGLIVRPSVDEPWRFLCPSAWGGPEVTEAIMTDDRELLITTETGLRRFALDGRPMGEVMSGFTAYDAPILVKGSTGIFGLLYDAGGSKVVRVDGAGVTDVYSSPVYQTGIASHEGRIYLGTSSSAEALFEILEESGQRVSTFRHGSDVRWVNLVEANGELLGVLHRTMGAELVRVGPPVMPSYETTDQLVGVVGGVGGRLILLIGDDLSILDGTDLLDVNVDARITCVGDGPPGPFACLYNTVRMIDGEGQLGDALFELPLLNEPSYDAMDAATALACRAEWIDLQSEGGLLPPTKPPPVPPPNVMEDESCGCVETRGSPTLMLFLICVFLARRR